MEYKFLFISTPLNRSFSEILAYVLSPYGKLEIHTWQENPDLSLFSLLFLDAGILADLDIPNSISSVMSELSRRCPGAKVVVTTASPTWKRTREALRAGAVDYIRQTLDSNQLHNDLDSTLKKYLKACPQNGE